VEQYIKSRIIKFIERLLSVYGLIMFLPSIGTILLDNGFSFSKSEMVISLVVSILYSVIRDVIDQKKV
jgi:hypothetical protein